MTIQLKKKVTIKRKGTGNKVFLCNGRCHWNVCSQIDAMYDNGEVQFHEGVMMCRVQHKLSCVRQEVTTRFDLTKD